MITKMNWADFREAGLLLLVNQFLHIFGWAIVVEIDDRTGELSVYPARVKFRGFDNETIERAYIKISEYMVKNAPDLLSEAKQDNEKT